MHDPNVTVYWFWFHKNIQIDPATDPRHQIHEEGSLEVWHVRSEDIGVYRCDVRSTGGNDTASANITVLGTYGPATCIVSLVQRFFRICSFAVSKQYIIVILIYKSKNLTKTFLAGFFTVLN